MYRIFIGSLILSTIHAMIPNHWLPLIAVGKTEKWTGSRTLWATVITGVAHTLSTILVGIVVGLIGYKLSTQYALISETVAPAILVGMGVIYLFLDLRSHRHHHDIKPVATTGNKPAWAVILATLSLAMFLTPCIEIEAYYFQAGSIGWIGIFIVSAVYLITTLTVMVLLVSLGMKGARSFNPGFLAHHEKAVTGAVLVGLGILGMGFFG